METKPSTLEEIIEAFEKFNFNFFKFYVVYGLRGHVAYTCKRMEAQIVIQDGWNHPHADRTIVGEGETNLEAALDCYGKLPKILVYELL
jgi:hypothetical protein